MELFLDKPEKKNEDLRKPLDYNFLYDLTILGTGPAGLTAALYAARKKLNIALLGTATGGQMLLTWDLENYMGFNKIEGFALTKKFEEQVSAYPVSMEEGLSVTSIKKVKNIFEVTLDNGNILKSTAVIIATGKKSRPLGVPGEEDYTGKGVAYCATCDAPLFKDRKVVVAGGGNSGVEAALELAKIASTVHVVELTDKLIADDILIDKLKQKNNVEILLHHSIKEIKGQDFVTEIILENLNDNKEKKLPIDGVFVEIGLIPNTDFNVSPNLKMNNYKEIIVDAECKTNIDGLFAAGDVTIISEKQVVIASGEGAKAALSANKYLQYQ